MRKGKQGILGRQALLIVGHGGAVAALIEASESQSVAERYAIGPN